MIVAQGLCGLLPHEVRSPIVATAARNLTLSCKNAITRSKLSSVFITLGPPSHGATPVPLEHDFATGLGRDDHAVPAGPLPLGATDRAAAARDGLVCELRRPVDHCLLLAVPAAA